MSERDFMFSRYFLRQLLMAMAVSVAIIWGVLKLLDLYTLHGRSIEVPLLEDYQKEDAIRLLESLDLRHAINDSIFDKQGEKGSIAAQDPAPGTEVKRNRTIYLTTVAVLPEMVPMPNLLDLSRRQAISLLETHGLQVGRLEYRPDIARNAVLEQKYNEGAIEPGTMVEMGTAIDLVLGEGLGENIVVVPMVIGLERQEAIRALNTASLNVGHEVFINGEPETGSMRVYTQEPNPLERTQYLQAGSVVDLNYRSAGDFDFEAYLGELLSVPMPDLTGMTPDQVRVLLDSLDLIPGEEFFEQGATRDNARVSLQEPAYQPDLRIPKGQTVTIWYIPADNEVFDDQ